VRVDRLDGGDAEERRDRGGGGGGFQMGAVRVGFLLGLGTRQGSGRVQEGTLVLAVREEHDTGLRARARREERGDGEHQHRRSIHPRDVRGRVCAGRCGVAEDGGEAKTCGLLKLVSGEPARPPEQDDVWRQVGKAS